MADSQKSQECLPWPARPPPQDVPEGNIHTGDSGKGKAKFYFISSWACVLNANAGALVNWTGACSMWVKGLQKPLLAH